jgi:septal ring factor EnvC (AmiA/AmiB activator)
MLKWIGEGVLKYGTKLIKHGENIPADMPKSHVNSLKKRGLIGELLLAVPLVAPEVSTLTSNLEKANENIIALESELEKSKNVVLSLEAEVAELKTSNNDLIQRIKTLENQKKTRGGNK